MGLGRSLGAYYPASHCMLLGHSCSQLHQAFERLFGRSLTDPGFLAREFLAADFLAKADVDWRKGGIFDDVLRYTTFAHELAHVRHLSASPLGFAMWVMSGMERVNNTRTLKNWSAKADAPFSVSLPLLSEEPDDPWLRKIASQRKLAGSLELGLLEPAPDEEAADWLWPLNMLWDELCGFFERVLKQERYGAEIAVPPNYPRGLSPPGLAGRAVIEGLASCNESIALLKLGAPPEILNRHALSKHGQYGPIFGYIKRDLGVVHGKAVLLAAVLLDWALQAPLLPFLLGNRGGSVELHELLPGWRFLRLVQHFADLRFTLDDVHQRYGDVEAELFASLGWASPSDLAERILRLDIPTPTSAGTRLAVRKFQVGAEIRARSPLTLAYPQAVPPLLESGEEVLLASIAVFADHGVVSIGDVENRDALLLTFADDLIYDALLGEVDVSQAQLLTDTLSQLLGGVPTGREIFRSRLRAMIGDVQPRW